MNRCIKSHQYGYLLSEGLPRLLLHDDVHLEPRLHLFHHAFALLLEQEAGHARRPDGDGLGADGGDQVAQHLLGRLTSDSQAVDLWKRKRPALGVEHGENLPL